jgi:two-component system chemotaxis response regulator CheY
MNRNILLVEDSGLTRLEVGDILKENFGATIIEASHGLEALASLDKTQQIDLVICDIEMPEMDGVEFIRTLRATDEYSYLPILVMTTLGQIKRRDDALNAGADAFIQKPVTTEALEDLLKDIW